MESSKVGRNIPQIPVVDAHYDLGMFLQQERQKGKRKIIETELMPELRRGGVQVLVSAIYVDENSVSGSALHESAVPSTADAQPHSFCVARRVGH